MISKPKAMALLVALSVLAIVSSALIEARLLEDHFLNAAVDQFKNNAEQLAGAVVDFDVPAGDNETCREIALWIYYNTGMRVLITDADSIVVVDSSSDSSLVGTAIESEDLKSTIATGETRSFDLLKQGKTMWLSRCRGDPAQAFQVLW